VPTKAFLRLLLARMGLTIFILPRYFAKQILLNVADEKGDGSTGYDSIIVSAKDLHVFYFGATLRFHDYGAVSVLERPYHDLAGTDIRYLVTPTDDSSSKYGLKLLYYTAQAADN
jgi:hypothetical protein